MLEVVDFAGGLLGSPEIASQKQDYIDDEQLLPRNLLVLVRRVLGVPRVPIVFAETQNPIISKKEAVDVPLPKCTQSMENSSSLKSSHSTITFDSALQLEGSEWDQCSDILFAEAKSPMTQDLTYNSERSEEDRMIAEIVNTPALDCSGKVFSRSVGNISKKPPEGYICHRCRVPEPFLKEKWKLYLLLGLSGTFLQNYSAHYVMKL